MNTKLSLFDGITPEEYNRMMVCFQASEKSFSTDETVCFYADHPDRIGYLLEGEAAIIRTHLDGRQTILEYLKTRRCLRLGTFRPVTKRGFFAGDLHKKLQDPVY